MRGLWPLALPALRPPPAETAPTTRGGTGHADAIIQEAIARGDIPGAILHVRFRGRVRYERAFGRKHIDGDVDVTPDDIFPVASLTKPVGAVAILQLCENGALRLGDPVSAYLPEFERPQVLVNYVAGMPLDRYLSRVIFGPLEMQHTYFFVPPDQRARVVLKYSNARGTIRAMPPDPFEGEARYLSGGGGLYTTIGDYARFGQALLDGGGPVLSRAGVDAMTRNQLGDMTAFGFRWGSAWRCRHPRLQDERPFR